MQLLSHKFNTNGSCRSKLSTKQIKAKQDHENWLKQNGVHISQIKKRTKNNKCKNTTVLFTTPVSKILEGSFENVGITGLKKQKTNIQVKIWWVLLLCIKAIWYQYFLKILRLKYPK